MDTQNRNTILVTWDNTDVSEFALQHAIRIANIVENNIRLLHVIDQHHKVTVEEEEKEFAKTVSVLSSQHSVQLEGVVLQGKIFKVISEYANDSDASMVIMGTHGIKGLQKITGSWALKVIVGSTIPFIVVQDKPHSNERYNSIVFPIDFKSENKEKLQWAIFLGKYFDSKIFLFKAPLSDKSLQKKININLNFAMKFLIKNNISYEIHSGKKASKFPEETIEFSQKINADLIIITTTKFINFTDYMLGAQEQYIIANSSKIPIMCVNPRASFASMGQFMFGSTQP
jgi:nucleotide-binding universal stress UspA family protein